MMRLFNWFRRGSLEHGLDRELQYHFDRRVADFTAAGIPEPEARRGAAVELGLAQVREEVRDIWLTAGYAISSTISASPPGLSPAAPALQPSRCYPSHSASAPPPPSTRWSIRSSSTPSLSATPAISCWSIGKANRSAAGSAPGT